MSILARQVMARVTMTFVNAEALPTAAHRKVPYLIEDEAGDYAVARG